MRIYEGSPRQDFEEVFRSIGAFIDQRGMREVLLVEAPDGFLVQGLVIEGAGQWSEALASMSKRRRLSSSRAPSTVRILMATARSRVSSYPR